ncbi:phosphatidate cytidylyltransferase [Pseudoflavonifractor phocaeensis]|uniref:phosphatidate cytidylyltransferase n=1 Tax=Pseudoflavonifractor phocaeensis TaxID=1870988 RepID=UPI00313B0927
MGKRIMVAVIFIPVIFVIFFWLPPVALPVAVSILSMIAVHEVLWSTGFVKNIWISGLSIVLAGVIPFWVFIGEGMRSALCGIFGFFVLTFVVAIGSHYTVTVEKMGGAFFFAAFIPYFLSSFIRIDAMELGKYLILLPLVASFTSDAFALFAGMAFGKHKLAPDLSPKKTVEGAVGGFAGAIVCCLVYGAVMQLGFGLSVSYLRLAVYGALGSVLSQLGDLSFSYIKRQYELKDFGNIFPGHGGVLDRFDSVLFCAPLIEILLHWLPAIGR